MKIIQTTLIIILVLTLAANAIETNETHADKKDVTTTQAVKEIQNTRTADDIINEQPKNYRPLAILSMIVVGVIGFGGIVLSYLYRTGYI